MSSCLAGLFVHRLHGDDNQGSWSGNDFYLRGSVPLVEIGPDRVRVPV